ncbi:hypothetical protein [Rhodopirellula europaea]|uniref:hypothetical protein n=1 Tax=Rhodopirellula europaea TaxID=1263866 RepID=UPI003D292C6A
MTCTRLLYRQLADDIPHPFTSGLSDMKYVAARRLEMFAVVHWAGKLCLFTD